MPQIIITAEHASDPEATVTLRERINVSDFESERFAANLVERLAWAVEDATHAERTERHQEDPADEPAESRAPRELVQV